MQASCRMRLVDPTGRLEADFEPPAVGVDPGRHGAGARPACTPRQRQWERRRRTLPFRIDAEQTGAPTVGASGTLVQTPMLPERLRQLGRRARRACWPLLAVGWFARGQAGHRRRGRRRRGPATRRRRSPTTVAQRPCRRDHAAPRPVATVATTATQTTVAATPTTAAVAGGTLFSQTLAPKVTLPASSARRRTPCRTGRHCGSPTSSCRTRTATAVGATFLIDDRTMLNWSLEFVTSVARDSFTSPIEAAGRFRGALRRHLHSGRLGQRDVRPVRARAAPVGHHRRRLTVAG